MFGLESGPNIGIGGHFHSKCSAEHGSDGSDNEGNCSIVCLHTINTEEDDASHKYHEYGAYFILSNNELAGPFLYNFSNLDWIMSLIN